MGFWRAWKKYVVAAAICILLAGGVVDVHLIDRTVFPPRKTDFVSVAFGAQATLRRQNPYSEAVTRQIQTVYYGGILASDSKDNPMAYVYPGYTALVLAPLALLSPGAAHAILLILLPLMAAATAALWLAIIGPPEGCTRGETYAAVVGLFLASWPVMWGIRLEQPTVIVAFLLALGCWLVRRCELQPAGDIAAGVLFAAAAIKPQLAGPLAALVAIWTVRYRSGAGKIFFTGTLSAALGVLLVACDTLIPGWVPEWRIASTHLLQTHQTPDLVTILGPAGWPAMVVLAGVIAVILYKARHDFAMSCAVVLAGTVALLPGGGAMIYNQQLLLPSVLLLVWSTGRSLLRTATLGLLGWQLIAVGAMAAFELIHPVPDDWPMLFRTTLFPAALILSLGQQLMPKRQAVVGPLPATEAELGCRRHEVLPKKNTRL